MKTIVTHMSVDIDAITSCWLIKSFLEGWNEAEIAFVASGKLWNNVSVDSDKEVMYVDTGLGKFDHHQTTDYTCASKRVFEYLLEEKQIEPKYIEGCGRLIRIITELDHFAECTFPDAASDRYDICLHQIIGSLKQIVGTDANVVSYTMPFLDASLRVFVSKIKAEKDIEKGYILETKWGKSLFMLSQNKESMKLAQKKGFTLVVTKDPDKGYVRIKIPPYIKNDLTPLYTIIKERDPSAYWYFHVSKRMLLNDSSQNPSSVPSSLTLPTLIEITRSL